jgi:hypothetical protein
LDELRRDFFHLAAIFISGDYGKFTWPEAAPVTEKPSLNWTQRLIAGLPRLVGIVLPLVIIILFLSQPAWWESTGLQPDLVTVIFIAWLLLSIDAALGLGIVSGVVNLAREIKELV